MSYEFLSRTLRPIPYTCPWTTSETDHRNCQHTHESARLETTQSALILWLFTYLKGTVEGRAPFDAATARWADSSGDMMVWFPETCALFSATPLLRSPWSSLATQTLYPQSTAVDHRDVQRVSIGDNDSIISLVTFYLRRGSSA
jgi:hypothetical protein